MQERGCLMHFACLANTLLKDEKSDQTITFLLVSAKYSPIYNFFSLSDSAVNLSKFGITTSEICSYSTL